MISTIAAGSMAGSFFSYAGLRKAESVVLRHPSNINALSHRLHLHLQMFR